MHTVKEPKGIFTGFQATSDADFCMTPTHTFTHWPTQDGGLGECEVCDFLLELTDTWNKTLLCHNYVHIATLL